MENVIIYLGKASLLLAVFYIAYYTLLKKETFFRSNRKFLLGGLLSAAVLPLLVLTRTVWVERGATAPTRAVDINQLLVMQENITPQTTAGINWYDVAFGIYMAGVLLFFARFVIDIQSIRRVLTGKHAIKHQGFKYIDSESVSSPFSFFNYIVYNSKTLNASELESIIQHEKVHSAQMHSLDMIISQLFCVIFWFNPVIWVYKKAIAQNLEFIADAEAVKQIEDIKDYQKTLVKITVQPESTAIINHFYQSLIKKRIVMLNKKQSKLRNSWKYAVVFPALAAFMFAFQLEVTAQEKDPDTDKPNKVIFTSTKVALTITKDSTNEDLEAEKSFFKDEFNTDVTFSDIKRNDKGEITAISVFVKSPEQSKQYTISGKNPIKDFDIAVTKDSNGVNSIEFEVAELQNTENKNINTEKLFFAESNNSPNAKSSAETIQFFESSSTPEVVKNTWSVDNFSINNKELLVVVNGEVQKDDSSIKLPISQEINTINVLDKKDGRKKYGRKGRKGVIEITTKGKKLSYSVQTIGDGDLHILSRSGNGIVYTMPDIDKMKRILAVSEITPGRLSLIQDELSNITSELNEIKFIDINEELHKISGEELSKARASIEEARSQMILTRKQLSLSSEEMELAKKQIEKARKLIEEERKRDAGN